jgi:hypothetical protein
MKGEEFIDKLDGFGWFEHFSDETAVIYKKEIEGIFSRQNKKSIPTYPIPCIFIDMECIHYFGDYEKVVNTLAEGSFGLFETKNLEEDVDEKDEMTILSFDLNGKHFTQTWAKTGSDYIEEDFWHFIEDALAKATPEIALTTIGSAHNGQIVFGPRKAINQIRKAKLISFKAVEEVVSDNDIDKKKASKIMKFLADFDQNGILPDGFFDKLHSKVVESIKQYDDPRYGLSMAFTSSIMPATVEEQLVVIIKIINDLSKNCLGLFTIDNIRYTLTETEMSFHLTSSGQNIVVSEERDGKREHISFNFHSLYISKMCKLFFKTINALGEINGYTDGNILVPIVFDLPDKIGFFIFLCDCELEAEFASNNDDDIYPQNSWTKENWKTFGI